MEFLNSWLKSYHFRSKRWMRWLCLRVTFPSSFLYLLSPSGVCLEVTKFPVNQMRMQWFSTGTGNVPGGGRNISWSPKADIITIWDLYDPIITLEESLERKDWGERHLAYLWNHVFLSDLPGPPSIDQGSLTLHSLPAVDCPSERSRRDPGPGGPWRLHSSAGSSGPSAETGGMGRIQEQERRGIIVHYLTWLAPLTKHPTGIRLFESSWNSLLGITNVPKEF